LALALNNRLDKPRIGTFAITPRQLAADLGMDILGEPLLSDIEVVRRLSEYSDTPMRFVHGEVENFKTIRRYTSNVKGCLKGKRSSELYDDYVKLPTMENVMERFDGYTDPFFMGKKIAVIGLELYDDLDRHFNPRPGEFEDIEIFKDDGSEYRIPEFREMYNDHQMAENAVSLIEKLNAPDFAIVLDVNSKIADAVRSELYRKGIPFINDLSIRDLNNIRDFIEFINRSLSFNVCKVSQVRELLHTYGGGISPKFDDYLVENYREITNDDDTIRLLSLMENIRDHTYGEVCEKITGKEGAQVKILLNQLNLTDIYVNTSDTADMVFSVNNFELKHNVQIPNNEKEGVLLVDCKNSVYIDRPVVIYLGLGPEWEKDLSDLNLIDYKFKDSIIKKDVAKFQILLQQGTCRIYICNSMKNGRKNKPCMYFEKAEEPEEPYESFSDIAKCIPGAWYNFEEKDRPEIGFENISADLEDFQFSNTSFNQFITCPRKFMFGRVIKSPDGEHTALGDYLHQYAEFRAAFPEKAKELGQEYFVKDISNRCMPLFSPEVRVLRESKIRSAVKELDWLIETYKLSEDVKIIQKDRLHDNVYFSLVDTNGNGSDCSEVKIVVRERHMNGTLDVVKNGMVFDFKTGSPKNPKTISESMDLTKISDYGKDMQCLFYLSLMMDLGVERPTFTFFSTAANEINDAKGIERDASAPFTKVVLMKDKEDCVRTLFPPILMNKSSSYDNIKNECDAMVDSIVNFGIKNVCSDHETYIPQIIDAMGIKTTKGNHDNVNTLLNIVDKMARRYYSDGDTVYVTMEEMEEFRQRIREAYDAVERMYATEFPMENPLMKCEKCDFKDVCIEPVAGGDSDE